MPANLIPIVEGHGDVEAVPVLLRRIATDLGAYDPKIHRPVRVSRHRIIKEGELERAVELAVRKGAGPCQVLILIDADTDCPKELAPRLLKRAKSARHDTVVEVVLAKMEFESWFLGDLGVRSPEEIQGAKERLEQVTHKPYSEVVDQPTFAATMSLAGVRAVCPSFDKCWRAVERLLNART